MATPMAVGPHEMQAFGIARDAMQLVHDQQQKIIEDQKEMILNFELREAFGRSDVTPLGYGRPTKYTERLVAQGIITLEQVDDVHWRARRMKR